LFHDLSPYVLAKVKPSSQSLMVQTAKTSQEIHSNPSLLLKPPQTASFLLLSLPFSHIFPRLPTSPAGLPKAVEDSEDLGWPSWLWDGLSRDFPVDFTGFYGDSGGFSMVILEDSLW